MIDASRDSSPRYQSPFRYTAYGFQNAGQDSNHEPPTQNPESFESLLNVLPPTDGVLERRWGYDRWPNAYGGTRLASYQKDSVAQRNIIVASATAVTALNEDGSVFDASLYTPTNTPEIAVSREYAYFTGDNKKWDGTASTSNITGWGIPTLQGTTSNATSGTVVNDNSNGGTVDWAVSGAGTLQSAISSDDTNYDTPTGLATGQKSKYLKCTNFGISLPAETVVDYVQVTFTYRWNGTAPGTAVLYAALLRNGVPASTIHGNQVVVTSTSPPIQFPAQNTDATDLFTFDQTDGDWLSTDLTSTNFGVVFYINGVTGFNFFIDKVHINVVYFGAPPTVAVAAGSGVTLTVGRKYCLVAVNSSTGHISDITAFSASTGPVTDDQINLTNIAVSTDAQVDYKYILATADGGDETTLYYVDSIPNATTTYTDTTSEATLLLRNLYLELDEFGNEIGVTGNQPPPTLDAVAKHRGRMYGISGQNVYYSKSEAELTTSTGTICGKFEESWPAEYFFDVSQGVELPRALLSDGESLYIGTEKHIYRLVGDGPDNFLKPEIAFNTVGVANQSVWQVVYNEGAAAGTIWLTPTKRVMWSDMNSFRDIGLAVQDILDTINMAAISTANAVAASLDSIDLYILAIPTGSSVVPDTVLIFEVGSAKWFKWTTTDSIYAQLFNVSINGEPQLLFSSDNRIYEWNIDSTQDQTGDAGAATNVTVEAQTAWLDLGDPFLRKALNEIELLTDSTTLATTIVGASNIREFGSPSTVVSGAVVSTNALGETKVPLAGRTSKDRYYRFTFTDTGTARSILWGYSVEASPLHRI